MDVRSMIPNTRPKERGQSLTELAISFTILMLLLSGAVDIGRAFFMMISLRDASQEGALYASIAPTDNTGIAYRATQSSTGPVDMSGASVSFSTAGSACAGLHDDGGTDVPNQITVTVSLPYQYTMPLITAFVPNIITLSSDTTVTILSPLCP